MYLAAMFLLLSPSLLCASVLSFCVFFPSVSKNINCICNCRGPDTPGTCARHSSKTHFQTNITSAFSLSHLSCGIWYVPQIKPRRHTSAHTPWTTTSKPKSASPHSAHVLFLLPCPSCTPTRTPPLLFLLRGQAAVSPLVTSHFLLAPPTLIWGQGLPSSHFPSPPAPGCSGWPYLLSLLSQTLAGGGPLIAYQAHYSSSCCLHTQVSVLTVCTHRYTLTQVHMHAWKKSTQVSLQLSRRSW